MAKLSLSAQLEAARIEIQHLRSENTGLREIAARAASKPAPRRSSVPSFSARAVAYCAEHGVRSVPSDVVRAWRAESSH